MLVSSSFSSTPTSLGTSRDWRTNRWRVTCPTCGFAFEPATTMLRYQGLICPKTKCKSEMMADYNAEPPIVKLVSG